MMDNSDKSTARITARPILQIPKRGELDRDCQDAGAINDASLRYAICDGAARSVLPAAWARLLSLHAIESGLPCRDDLEQWLTKPRQDWSHLRSLQLAGSQQSAWWVRVPGRGAATLACLEFQLAPTSWQAAVVGDSCIFQIRKDTLVQCIPEMEPADFNDNPDCLLSMAVASDREPRLVTSSGTADPGDTFMLATDALSQWILTEHARNEPVWKKLSDLQNVDDLRLLVDEQRAGDQMPDDVHLQGEGTVPEDSLAAAAGAPASRHNHSSPR